MRSVVVWGRWLHMVNGMEEGDESGGQIAHACPSCSLKWQGRKKGWKWSKKAEVSFSWEQMR